MNVDRPDYIRQLTVALGRSPVVALLGPRQCGKTTLARMIGANQPCAYFDLEKPSDLRRLENAEYVLGSEQGLVILDEIQLRPELFSILRTLVDRPDDRTRFLILGSASPRVIKGASESLAGRIEFVELHGFDLGEIGADRWEDLWVRGLFPRSFLARNSDDSLAWREGLIQTYLQRDLPELGIHIPSATMRRFWTMLAHYHGRLWNASELGRALGISDKTIRHYLDILTDTFMIRQVHPWYVNVGKRQVKSPKIYLRDSGLLHALLDLSDRDSLLGHPVVGASWEGFALEQIVRVSRIKAPYFWGTYAGAELDLLFQHRGKWIGVEFKFSDAPAMTKSMYAAMDSLNLSALWIVAPVEKRYALYPGVEVCPLGVWSRERLYQESFTQTIHA